MVEETALGLTTYVVERAFDKSMVTLALNFKDESGNTVLSTAAQFLVIREALETPDGRTLGTVTHKVMSFPQTFELHEGGVDGQVNGIIKQEFTWSSLAGSKTVAILNPDGQPMATANGDFMNFNFTITHADGSSVANVSRTFGGGGFKNSLMAAIKDQYTMKILQKDKVPTLVLLEFLVVLEIMMHESHGGGHGGQR